MMTLDEKIKKVTYIADTICPFNHLAYNYLDTFYLGFYKDYSHFSLKELKQKWTEYIDEHNTELVDFYIHIPFCVSKCSYCNYFKETDLTKIDSYLENLEYYFSYLHDILSRVKVSNLYVGGGTPSILNPKQMQALLKSINSYVTFNDRYSFAFEVNPITITPEKLQILKQGKVNRLSLGIQTFKKELLESTNRSVYSFNYIKETIELIRSYGFEIIALDLLMGLHGDNPVTFINSFKKILSLNPEEIYIYVLNPVRDYLKAHYNNDYQYFSKKLRALQESTYPMILKIMKEHGGYNYESISLKRKSVIFYKKLPEEIRNKYPESQYSDHGLNVVPTMGFGVSSRSNIPGKMIIKYDRDKDYLTFSEDKKIFYGHHFTPDDNILQHVWLEMYCQKNIDIQEVNEMFNIDFLKKYESILTYLFDTQKMKLEGRYVYEACKTPYDAFTSLLLFVDDKIIHNIYQNCVEQNYE